MANMNRLAHRGARSCSILRARTPPWTSLQRLTLTDELIEGGALLLKEPDAAHVTVDAAFWFYYPEQDIWKLVLSLPTVVKRGPRAAYSKIQKAIAKFGNKHLLTLNDIAIAKIGAPIVRILQSAIRTGPGISGIRFSNNVINGQLISDAYIYRLQQHTMPHPQRA